MERAIALPLGFYCRSARLCLKKAALAKRSGSGSEELQHLRRFEALVAGTIPSHRGYVDKRGDKSLLELETYLADVKRRILELLERATSPVARNCKGGARMKYQVRNLSSTTGRGGKSVSASRLIGFISGQGPKRGRHENFQRSVDSVKNVRWDRQFNASPKKKVASNHWWEWLSEAPIACGRIHDGMGVKSWRSLSQPSSPKRRRDEGGPFSPSPLSLKISASPRRALLSPRNQEKQRQLGAKLPQNLGRQIVVPSPKRKEIYDKQQQLDSPKKHPRWERLAHRPTAEANYLQSRRKERLQNSLERIQNWKKRLKDGFPSLYDDRSFGSKLGDRTRVIQTGRLSKSSGQFADMRLQDVQNNTREAMPAENEIMDFDSSKPKGSKSDRREHEMMSQPWSDPMESDSPGLGLSETDYHKINKVWDNLMYETYKKPSSQSSGRSLSPSSPRSKAASPRSKLISPRGRHASPKSNLSYPRLSREQLVLNDSSPLSPKQPSNQRAKSPSSKKLSRVQTVVTDLQGTFEGLKSQMEDEGKRWRERLSTLEKELETLKDETEADLDATKRNQKEIKKRVQGLLNELETAEMVWAKNEEQRNYEKEKLHVLLEECSDKMAAYKKRFDCLAMETESSVMKGIDEKIQVLLLNEVDKLRQEMFSRHELLVENIEVSKRTEKQWTTNLIKDIIEERLSPISKILSQQGMVEMKNDISLLWGEVGVLSKATEEIQNHVEHLSRTADTYKDPTFIEQSDLKNDNEYIQKQLQLVKKEGMQTRTDAENCRRECQAEFKDIRRLLGKLQDDELEMKAEIQELKMLEGAMRSEGENMQRLLHRVENDEVARLAELEECKALLHSESSKAQGMILEKVESLSKLYMGGLEEVRMDTLNIKMLCQDKFDDFDNRVKALGQSCYPNPTMSQEECSLDNLELRVIHLESRKDDVEDVRMALLNVDAKCHNRVEEMMQDIKELKRRQEDQDAVHQKKVDEIKRRQEDQDAVHQKKVDEIKRWQEDQDAVHQKKVDEIEEPLALGRLNLQDILSAAEKGKDAVAAAAGEAFDLISKANDMLTQVSLKCGQIEESTGNNTASGEMDAKITKLRKKVDKLESEQTNLTSSVVGVHHSIDNMQNSASAWLEQHMGAAHQLKQVESRLIKLERSLDMAERPQGTMSGKTSSLDSKEDGQPRQEDLRNKDMLARLVTVECNLEHIASATYTNLRILDAKVQHINVGVQSALEGAAVAERKCGALGAEVVKIFRALVSSNKENGEKQGNFNNPLNNKEQWHFQGEGMPIENQQSEVKKVNIRLVTEERPAASSKPVIEKVVKSAGKQSAMDRGIEEYVIRSPNMIGAEESVMRRKGGVRCQYHGSNAYAKSHLSNRGEEKGIKKKMRAVSDRRPDRSNARSDGGRLHVNVRRRPTLMASSVVVKRNARFVESA